MTKSQEETKLLSERQPELIIALAGPIGTDFGEVTDIFSNELGKVGYQGEPIRISQLMRDLDSSIPDPEYADDRYLELIKAGTRFREESKDASVLALLSSMKIQYIRKNITSSTKSPAKATAYIIRSLKHPDEVQALRMIYGQAFFLVGVTTSRTFRKDKLSSDIRKSHHGVTDFDYGSKAEKLIEIDEEERGSKKGQRLRDTFALSDVFVSGDRKDKAQRDIKRFIKLLFGEPYISPKKDENALFLSHAIALRSSDLSRQVGAVITNTDGDIIASGCNEVPKYSGGAYWEGDDEDGRDHKLGEDPSHTAKIEMLSEVFSKLKSEGWLEETKKNQEIGELVNQALYQDGKSLMKGVRLMDTLEFGRVVHAEMHAITDAAKRGISVSGATLYCTTFPCHMCARHIVSAGISRVVFIEPYPKSMAESLYKDSISLGENGVGERVQFEPFSGIAPNRYQELFMMPKRKHKETGKAIKWEPNNATLKTEVYPWRALNFETLVNKRLKETLIPRIKRHRISNEP